MIRKFYLIIYLLIVSISIEAQNLNEFLKPGISINLGDKIKNIQNINKINGDVPIRNLLSPMRINYDLDLKKLIIEGDSIKLFNITVQKVLLTTYNGNINAIHFIVFSNQSIIDSAAKYLGREYSFGGVGVGNAPALLNYFWNNSNFRVFLHFLTSKNQIEYFKNDLYPDYIIAAITFYIGDYKQLMK